MLTLLRTRLGADFAKLWTASTVSNVGDGVTMAAGPLLVASISDDPALVAGAVFVQQLPWLLFALLSGAYVDRVDRRRLMVVVNVMRAIALLALAATIVTGTVTVVLIYVVFFLLGTGETLSDTAAMALLPAVVTPDNLGRANARLSATFAIGNQFVAKPLGAWLFVLAAAAPFGFDALTFAVAALLMAAITKSPPAEPRPPTSLRTDIVEGLRWLWGNRLLRTMAVSIGLSNVAFCAAFAVFVLYCRERLGLSDVGYGFLLTTFAVGGLVGSTVAVKLATKFGSTAVLRGGLIVEGVTHLTLAATTIPWVAAAVLVLFGIQTMVWGIIVSAIRQRIAPSHLLGRVGSVYSLLNLGGAALGTVIGGLLAKAWSVTTPFWLAAVAMLIIAVAAWRPLRMASA